MLTKSFASQKPILKLPRLLIIANSNEYTFSRCKMVVMCFSWQTKQWCSNAWSKQMWSNKGMKIALLLFRIIVPRKWWVNMCHHDHELTPPKLPLYTTWKKSNQLQNTKWKVCGTEFRISSRCRMTRRNSRLWPIIFYGPTLLLFHENIINKNNQNTGTGFLYSKNKRCPFQNIILERSLVWLFGQNFSIYSSRSDSSLDAYNTIPSRPGTLHAQISSFNR